MRGRTYIFLKKNQYFIWKIHKAKQNEQDFSSISYRDDPQSPKMI